MHITLSVAVGGGLFLLGLVSLVGGFGVYSKHGALIHLFEVFLVIIGAIVLMVF